MKRLYRSRTDEMIAGVCGGLADYLNVDPTIVRLVFLLLFFAGGGGFWIYLVLWIIMPLEPASGVLPIEVVEKSAPPEAKKETKKVPAPKPPASGKSGKAKTSSTSKRSPSAKKSAGADKPAASGNSE